MEEKPQSVKDRQKRNAVDKRLQRSEGLRKDKRLAKLAQFRKSTPEQGAFEENRSAFKGLEALGALQQCLLRGTDDQICDFVDHLAVDQPDFVRHLVTEAAERPTQVIMDILVCLTNSPHNYTESLSMHMMQECQFVQRVAYAHLEQQTPFASDVWWILANVVANCRCALPERIMALLIEQMHHDQCQDAQMTRVLMLTVATVCESRHPNMDQQWISGAFVYVVRMLMVHIHPEPRRVTNQEMNGRHCDHALDYAVCSLYLMFKQLANHPQSMHVIVDPVQQETQGRLVNFFVNMTLRVDDTNVVRVCYMLAQWTKMDSYTNAFRGSQCVKAMHALLHSGHDYIQSETCTWIANYVQFGMDCVTDCVQNLDMFQALMRVIQSQRSRHSTSNAIYAIRCMCNVALDAHQNNIQQTQCASDFFTTLLDRFQLIRNISRLPGAPGLEDMSCDILVIYCALLDWNAPKVIPELENYSAMDFVMQAQAGAHTAMAKYADYILERHYHTADDNDDDGVMDLSASQNGFRF